MEGRHERIRVRAALKLSIVAAIALIVPAESWAAPGTGSLLGTNANGGVLLEVDPGNGSAVAIGFMGVGSTPALATDSLTDDVYVATGSGNPNLFAVDPTNGVTTFVGNTGLGIAAVGGMDFDAQGNLYAAVNIAGDGGTGSDHLAILNINNGQATIIGPFGDCLGVPPIPVNGAGFCTIEGIEGIAFDEFGTLWGVHTARGAAGFPGLYIIDPGTGAASFVSPILDAGGSPPSGGLSSIQFECDGTLFGGTARGTFVNDGGFLVTIDPLTGEFAFAGGVSATGGSSLGGLAFEDSVCNAPPDCSAATADSDLLWPPNHKFREIAVLGVTDPDGDPVTIAIDSILQDEPLDGAGDGSTSPDGAIGSSTASVRAERAGGGNGRVYQIGFTASDDQGGSCSGAVTVCVPHDRRKGGSCIDDGLDLDSTGYGLASLGQPSERYAMASSGLIVLLFASHLFRRRC